MMDGAGAAPAPAPRGRASSLTVHASGGGRGAGQVSSRTSSALAAVSIVLILLYLFWRFIWQCRKHKDGRSGPTSSSATIATGTPSSSAPPPSCPSPGAAAGAAYGAGEAAARRPPHTTTTTTTLPVFAFTAAAGGFGAEKVECAVCLAELGDGEAAARLVPGCGHGFHAGCIEAWLRVNTTCPLCRAAVNAAGAGQSAGDAAPRRCSSV